MKLISRSDGKVTQSKLTFVELASSENKSQDNKRLPQQAIDIKHKSLTAIQVSSSCMCSGICWGY